MAKVDVDKALQAHEKAEGSGSGEDGEYHEGKRAAMADFHAAHSAGDHEGMKNALEDFIDQHEASKASKK